MAESVDFELQAGATQVEEILEPALAPVPAPMPGPVLVPAPESGLTEVPAPVRPWLRQAGDYARLMRLDRPIGIWLLLWPTLWALWIAGHGKPEARLFVIFVIGTVLMRSAGCAINDYADRSFDPHVERTKDRPLAACRISTAEALVLFAAP